MNELKQSDELRTTGRLSGLKKLDKILAGKRTA